MGWPLEDSAGALCGAARPVPSPRAKRNSDSYSFLTGLRSILRNQALMQFSFLGLFYTLEIEDILHQRVSWEGLSDQLGGGG